MSDKRVTFETKCWERDWKLLLRAGRLESMIERCNFNFDSRVLYVNNVADAGRVMAEAQSLVKTGVLTGAVLVEDHAAAALARFGIDKSSFAGGYWYSIQELVGIHLCKTPFLLHFSSESMITTGGEWIVPAIDRMEMDECIVVANPNWDQYGDQAKAESFSEDDLFFRGRGFSDQCYLVRAAGFAAPIYNETNASTDVYPRYGGELFEKRVNSYMRNHGLCRITHKTVYFRHKNFPRDPFRRMIMRLTGVNLKKG
jgi:hypothetical protein